jgi:hypothetical protein
MGVLGLGLEAALPGVVALDVFVALAALEEFSLSSFNAVASLQAWSFASIVQDEEPVGVGIIEDML